MFGWAIKEVKCQFHCLISLVCWMNSDDFESWNYMTMEEVRGIMFHDVVGLRFIILLSFHLSSPLKTITKSLTPTYKSKVEHESRKNYFKLTSITREGQKYYFVQIQGSSSCCCSSLTLFYLACHGHPYVCQSWTVLNCLPFHFSPSLLLPLFDRSTPMLTTRLTYEGLLCHTLSIVMCVKPHARTTRKCCSFPTHFSLFSF